MCLCTCALKMSFELSLALRYLKKSRHGFFAFITTLVAIGGVTIGVAAMIITLAVMNGFRSDIQEKTLGIQPHIVVSGTEKDSEIAVESLQDRIRSVRKIDSVAPFILGQTLLKSPQYAQGIIVRGIVPQKEFSVTDVKKTLIAGSWEELEPESKVKNSIVLGKELARNLGVTVGDEIIALSPTETAPIGLMGNIPKMQKYAVTGIFQAGFYEYDSGLAFISLSNAKNLFTIVGVSGIGVKTADLEKADEIVYKVTGAIGPNYWARSWQSMNRNLFKALKLEKLMMSIILTLIILVASFTIISNLILMTIEKSKDIGILKALGSSRISIQKIFLYAGITLGSIGIFIGTFLGITVTVILGKTQWIKLPQDVYYIDTLPVKLSAMDITTVLVSALLITILSAVYPAFQASKINPVDAIRYG